MATISQAIASLEQQLSELTYQDGSKIFERIYTSGANARSITPPCAVLTVETAKQVRVKIYLSGSDPVEAEKIHAIADVCRDKWGIQGLFDWMTLPVSVYRTFTFWLSFE